MRMQVSVSKNFVFIFTIALLTLGVLGYLSYGDTVPPQTIVKFPDVNLAKKVREALNLSRSDDITKAHLETLTILPASSVGWQAPSATKIRNLTGLEHATQLTSLILTYNEIKDITPLAGLTQLTHLYLGANKISDITPLAGLTQLTWLDIDYNYQISDIQPLAGLTQLTLLHLIGNRINDIQPLIGLTQLTQLGLAFNQISDISQLAELMQLKILRLDNNQIENVSPLAGLTNLEYLSLDHNLVSDISPLNKLTRNTSISWNNNPGFPTGGPKITGPWLWILVPGTRLDDNTDFLALASGGTVTEQEIATKGAKKWAVVGDSVWTSYEIAATGRNNINQLTESLGWGTGVEIYDHIIYGSIVLDSPREQHTNMFVGSDDAVKVWLNGKLVHQVLIGRGAENYQEFFSVTLKQGTNVLLVAVDNHGFWDFSGFFGFAPDAEYTVAPAQGAEPLDDAAAAWIPDPNLRAAVRDALMLASNEPLTQQALKGLTDLDAEEKGISNITGLEHATQLTNLNLNYNQISDISSLTGLTQLIWLNLWANQISDMTPLTGLTQLIWLDLEDNQISDVSALAGLINLEYLYLDGNPITDMAPLQSLLEKNPNIEIDIDVGDVSQQPADVNGDGVVNIQDLVLVAGAFGERGEHIADVNGDGVVNIQDLVLVAGAFGDAAAAPTAHNLSTLTPETVQQWLAAAKQLQFTDATSRRGIAVLEQLLAALVPKETALLANYPNPFNPETWIPYQLSKPTDVTVTIYAANGAVVRTLALGHQPAGMYQTRSRAAYWDGRNTLGEPVASGVYFYTLTAGEFTATRKMLIRK